MIAPGFGGINLEDIAAPRCFEIEARLRAARHPGLPRRPARHGDLVLAALTNALRVVGKKLADVRVVVAGAGAAGTAIVKLLLAAGVSDIVVWDREGLLSSEDTDLPLARRAWPRAPTRARSAATCTTGSAAPTSSSASARPTCSTRTGSRTWPRRGRLRAGQPRPRGRPRGGRQVRRRGRDRPLRLPQPDQQRAGLPGRLPRACSTPAPRSSPRTWCCAPPSDRRRGQRRGDQPEFHHPQRLQPRVPKAVAAAIRGVPSREWQTRAG